MICTWQQLLELRSAGKRPTMKLVVTSSRRFAYGFDEIGVMAILHTRGEPMPVELLEGLQVIFHFEDCAQSSAVSRLLSTRGVTLEWYRFWCECYDELTTIVMPCNENHESMRWIDSLPTGGKQAA